MIKVTFPDLLTVLDLFLRGDASFPDVCKFVFRYYEGEEEIDLDEDFSKVLPVIAPYVEHAEAFGDAKRIDRIRRLRAALDSRTALAERAVFGLEFDRVMELHSKLKTGKISGRVYDEQLRKLSPALFDPRRVALWAASHEGVDELDPARMI